MIFSDEKRFTKDVTLHQGTDLAAYKGNSDTLLNLGPGSHYNAANESVRSGWKKKSFSKREPMERPSIEIDRSTHYTSGVLAASGLYTSPPSPGLRVSPGPGQYLGVTPSSSRLPSSQDKSNHNISYNQIHNNTMNSTRTLATTLPQSPRMPPPNTLIQYGLVVHGTSDAKQMSPGVGQYHKPETLLKKSFNTRVNKKTVNK